MNCKAFVGQLVAKPGVSTWEPIVFGFAFACEATRSGCIALTSNMMPQGDRDGTCGITLKRFVLVDTRYKELMNDLGSISKVGVSAFHGRGHSVSRAHIWLKALL